MMKFNLFLVFISIAFAGLAAFSFFITNMDAPYRIHITVGSGLSLFVTLSGMLALTLSHRGATLNVRFVSGLFVTVLLIEHIVFSFISASFPPYIIITGVLLVLYILICYLIIRVLK